jgi:hypothetical protein
LLPLTLLSLALLGVLLLICLSLFVRVCHSRLWSHLLSSGIGRLSLGIRRGLLSLVALLRIGMLHS